MTLYNCPQSVLHHSSFLTLAFYIWQYNIQEDSSYGMLFCHAAKKINISFSLLQEPANTYFDIYYSQTHGRQRRFQKKKILLLNHIMSLYESSRGSGKIKDGNTWLNGKATTMTVMSRDQIYPKKPVRQSPVVLSLLLCLSCHIDSLNTILNVSSLLPY